MEKISPEDVQLLQYELRAKEDALRSRETKLKLLEGLQRRTQGLENVEDNNLQEVSLEDFLIILGMGTSVHDRIRGNAPINRPMAPEKLHAKRNNERVKYEGIYLGHHPTMANYGTAEHWTDVYGKLCEWEIKSLCDVGTGRGGLPRTLYRETDIELAVGIDFAMTQKMASHKQCQKNGTEYQMKLLRAPAHAIPFEDKKFEWVTSFDMLEHLVPQEVDEVIAEFQRAASKGLILSIAYKDSIFRIQGLSLHQTIRPRSWWIKTIRRVTGWNVGHYKSYIIAVPGELPKDVKLPVECLFDEPAPEEMILLGKGPSLDKWDGSETNGRPVMALNEAMVKRPCDYGIYTDSSMKKLEPPDNVTLIRPQFVIDQAPKEFIFDRNEYGKQVVSTAQVALSIMDAWGVRKVLMVGFDAYDTAVGPVYADCVTGLISNRASSDFTTINETIDNTLKACNLEVEWWHRQLATKSKESIEA